ncbi:hypothetical protein [Streptomyces chrestomyceticus]|uniref:WXG100-like domain-containing protein n=1 Tax=Streptomyces chrestomyceticus TaxID=68185 RepID=UPI00340E5828
MSAADKAKEIVQDLTGMWWPEGDEDELREAARAWRTFADDVEDVTAAAHKPAQDVIDNNKGPGIEAFGDFWRKYHGGGKGYLDDVASAARDMAKALDKFADEIAAAKKKIEHALEIAGAVLVAGTALALFTGGISEIAAAGATEAIVAAAGAAGVAVSATVAEIAGTVLATAAVGSVEAITVDVVVAQGGRNLLGEQKGISLAEMKDAGTSRPPSRRRLRRSRPRRPGHRRSRGRQERPGQHEARRPAHQEPTARLRDDAAQRGRPASGNGRHRSCRADWTPSDAQCRRVGRLRRPVHLGGRSGHRRSRQGQDTQGPPTPGTPGAESNEVRPRKKTRSSCRGTTRR